MSNDLKQAMLVLIQSAADLANSVEKDIRDGRSISNTTIILLNTFDMQLNEIQTELDILNGIN